VEIGNNIFKKHVDITHNLAFYRNQFAVIFLMNSKVVGTRYYNNMYFYEDINQIKYK